MSASDLVRVVRFLHARGSPASMGSHDMLLLLACKSTPQDILSDALVHERNREAEAVRTENM
eukprot:2660039-Rhodomonas_salina.1